MHIDTFLHYVKQTEKKGKFTINILLFPQKQKVFIMRTDFIGINNAALNTVSTSSQRHLK